MASEITIASTKGSGTTPRSSPSTISPPGQQGQFIATALIVSDESCPCNRLFGQFWPPTPPAPIPGKPRLSGNSSVVNQYGKRYRCNNVLPLRPCEKPAKYQDHDKRTEGNHDCACAGTTAHVVICRDGQQQAERGHDQRPAAAAWGHGAIQVDRASKSRPEGGSQHHPFTNRRQRSQPSLLSASAAIQKATNPAGPPPSEAASFASTASCAMPAGRTPDPPRRRSASPARRGRRDS